MFSQLQPERKQEEEEEEEDEESVCVQTCVSEHGCKCEWVQTADTHLRFFNIHNEIQSTTAGWTHPPSFFQDFQPPRPFYLPSAYTTKSLFPPFCWLKITPLQPNNEARFLLWGLNLTCMVGIVGSEGFQLLSVSVTDKQGGGTMGRRPLASVRLSCCQTDSRCLG